jgi:hypothetical protein
LRFHPTRFGSFNYSEQFIVKRQIVKPLVVLLGLAFGGVAGSAALAADAAAGVYAKEDANGSVELSNIPSSDNQEPVVAAPAAATAATGSASEPAGAAPADGQTGAAEPPKDPRQQLRDTVLQRDQGSSGATSNASRRYKMMDKATYQATVLGNTPTAATPAQ